MVSKCTNRQCSHATNPPAREYKFLSFGFSDQSRKPLCPTRPVNGRFVEKGDQDCPKNREIHTKDQNIYGKTSILSKMRSFGGKGEEPFN